MTSLYRQETQVGVVKSWLKQKQLVGSLSRAFLVPTSSSSLGHHHPWAPKQTHCGGVGRKGGKATEPHPCQLVILATHQCPDVRISPFYR